jgi:alpha-mannosidase
MWKDLLLNQFHDVLPGTSIAMAIQDALDIYAKRIEQAKRLYALTLQALGEPGDEVVAFDPYRRPRTELVALEQTLTPVSIGASGLGVELPQQPVSTARAERDGSQYALSNGRLRLVISEGRIVSLQDLQVGRELITPGPGTNTGGLMLYDDFPLAYDAWDAEIYHLDCGRELLFDTVEVESSPLRSSLKATSKFGSSVAVLTVSSSCGGVR